MKKSAYAQAGVDIDEMAAGLSAIKRMVKDTARPEVLGGIGAFGGLFRSPGKNQILVASTDGVGTKLAVAAMADRHDTVGQDLVNHCVNDILVQGAEPLFFLDYLGTSHLSAKVFSGVVRGLCKACKANGCALLGGETAEMPGLYPRGEYDLVGTVVGSVARNRLVTGENIRPGDIMLGLPSSGLHTNGYSLARKVFFETAGLKLTDLVPGTRRTVARELLAIHRSYLKPVTALLSAVRAQGMAHITGGGLVDNLPRILPGGAHAVVNRGSWTVPAVFRFIEDAGSVDPEEMFRVFNQGIGFVIIVRKGDAAAAEECLNRSGIRARRIGYIEYGEPGVTLA